MGALGTLGVQWCIKRLARRGLYKGVEAAYMNLRLVCEPQTIDPAHPGNDSFMRSRARDTVNPLIMSLRRAGFDPPSKCNTNDTSLREWFKFLEDVRIKLR